MNRLKIIKIFGSCAVLALCASCSTPDKIIQQVTQTAAITELQANTESESSSEQVPMVTRSDPNATVTAIVLPMEERGNPQAIITAEPTEIPAYNAVDTSYAAAAPAVVSAQTSAETLKVYSFAPAEKTVLQGGQAFHLDVTLYNAGTTTWLTNYLINNISAIAYSPEKSFAMPMAVAPGGTALISMYIVAPSELGEYSQKFEVRDTYGVVFGTFEYTFIVGEVSSVTEIPTWTPIPTSTPEKVAEPTITPTPNNPAWMCTDSERSTQYDGCLDFCQLNWETYPECYYDGLRFE